MEQPRCQPIIATHTQFNDKFIPCYIFVGIILNIQPCVIKLLLNPREEEIGSPHTNKY
jgi:hypothetical protein